MEPTSDQQAALDALEQLLQGEPGEALPQRNVMGGFFAAPSTSVSSAQALREDPNIRAPRPYYEGDEMDYLSRLNTESLGALQDSLIAAGIIRSAIPGERDDATVRGVATLMTLANRAGGTRWQEVLSRIQQAGGAGDAGGVEQFEKPPLVIDYASIAEEVKATFRRRLGRDPDDFEMDQMTAAMTDLHRTEYEQANAVRLEQFNQQQTPGAQHGSEFRMDDPVARFQQVFEEKYSGELDFVQDKADAQVQRAAVEGGVGLASQMSRRSF